jgi:hypothetical protein
MLCLLYRLGLLRTEFTRSGLRARAAVNDASARRNLSCPSTLWEAPIMLWLIVLILLILAIGGGIAISKFLFLLLIIVVIVALVGGLGRS